MMRGFQEKISPEKSPPDTKPNPEPTPEPSRGGVFSGGFFPDTDERNLLN